MEKVTLRDIGKVIKLISFGEADYLADVLENRAGLMQAFENEDPHPGEQRHLRILFLREIIEALRQRHAIQPVPIESVPPESIA